MQTSDLMRLSAAHWKLLTGEPLGQWMTDRQAAGDSLRTISFAMRERSDGDIDVTPTTVARWIAALAPEAVSAGAGAA